jgi:hypothetical protein
LGINEKFLLKDLVEKSKDQNDFYVLDIGAGEFQWGKALATFALKEIKERDHLKIHIINVRGEPLSGPTNSKVEHFGFISLYYFGAFKVEDVANEFFRRKMHVHNRLDLAFSRWTLRHLVNPVGTVEKIYNLLRPKTGLFLFDGFYFCFGSEKITYKDMYPKMLQLLTMTKAPFLARSYRQDESIDQFMLQRKDVSKLSLPIKFRSLRIYHERLALRSASSRSVCEFRANSSLPRVYSKNFHENVLKGDKSLYFKLRQAQLIQKKVVWMRANNYLNKVETKR